MTGHEWEIAVLVAGAVIYGFINTLFRRAESTGKRMGDLERAKDHAEGFAAGRLAGIAEERERRQGNGR